MKSSIYILAIFALYCCFSAHATMNNGKDKPKKQTTWTSRNF